MKNDKKKWRILVVDDDQDVLTATEQTLEFTSALERDLEIVTANSAAQTDAVLAEQRDFAVILLDVVMETPHAGLQLVRRIRQEYQMDKVRILMRTGQAGMTPERVIVGHYEVDDFIVKSGADRLRIESAVITAIRAFNQLERLDRLKIATEQTLLCANALAGVEDTTEFGAICMRHLVAIFGPGVSCALALAERDREDGAAAAPIAIVAATPEHAQWVDRRVGPRTDQTPEPQFKITAGEVIQAGQSLRSETQLHLYIRVSERREAVLWISHPEGLDDIDQQVADLLVGTIRVCLDRMGMLQDRMAEAMVSMGILAHEFRTPIASLMLSQEFMTACVAHEKIDYRRFETVLGNMEQTLTRMNQHIDTSMNNVGIVLKQQFQLPVARENIGNLITSTLTRNKMVLDPAGEMATDVEDDVWAMVDRTTLEQVLLNLLSNATKALIARSERAPGVQLSIKLLTTEEHVVIRVADRGTGIEPENMGRIFDPFYSSSGMPSHGLGLTMARKSMRAMGGEITCTSTFGEGTVFDMVLPS